MGVLIPAYSISLEKIREEFSIFRKSLRKEDQLYFDKLFTLASRHIQAGNAQGHYDPLEIMLLSTILELLKRIEVLEQKVNS